MIRLRRRLRSIGLPSSTTITGSPSSTGRSRGKRKLAKETATVSSAIVAADEQRAGDREVVLRHALLDEVADHHEHDQVEGLERARARAGRSRASADRRRGRRRLRGRRDPSGKDRHRAVDVRGAACRRRAARRPAAAGRRRRVDLEVDEEDVLRRPRGCGRGRSASLPSRLASPTGDGSIVLSVMPSTQPGVEHERRVLDLALGADREARHEEEAAAEARRASRPRARRRSPRRGDACCGTLAEHVQRARAGSRTPSRRQDASSAT